MGGCEERSSQSLVQLLDPDGTLASGREPSLDGDQLVSMFSDMRLARRLDDRGVSLQRQGTLGLYGEVAGQEAGMVASTHAIEPQDWLVPSYREYPALRAHGLPLRYVYAWFMGKSKGSRFPTSLNALPLCVPVASQLPQAVGLAWAADLTGSGEVVIVHFGDGATSEGDFHEALNFAGVFDLPVIFLCHNNQWAISTPRDRQTASETLAQKARAYGFEGVRVDGMDPLAVYEVTREARDRAAGGTSGPAPTLIESVEYRFGAHSTADDPSVYRDEAAVEQWRERDPLDRFETYLRDRGLLDDGRLDTIDERIETELSAEFEAARAFEEGPSAMFDQVFATPIRRLQAQRDGSELR